MDTNTGSNGYEINNDSNSADVVDGQCIGRLRNDDEDGLQGFSNNNNIPRASQARMPIEKDSKEYNMKHKKRGMALIFHHETFQNSLGPERKGSDEECNNLKRSLNKLGFSVQNFKDLNYADIMEHIHKTAYHTMHDDCDCIWISVLTHGNGTVLANDRYYDVKDLWTPFTADKCPSLAGKPKIFLIQACRGNKFDDGITLRRGTTEFDGDMKSYTIAAEADFLIIYSTVDGYYSWRKWLVQALCHELETSAFSEDLITILTNVKRRVTVDNISYTVDPAESGKKQVPCTVDTLIRKIRFRK